MDKSPGINGASVVKLTVFSNGTQLDESIKIISVVVDKSINKIPRSKLVFLDGDMPEKDFPISNADHFKPGNEIKINAGYDDDESVIFEGFVIKTS